MKHAWAIAAKEWRRFFAGRGYALITVLLPGLLLWSLYSAMGEMDMDEPDTLTIAVENLPASFEGLTRAASGDIEFANAPSGLDTAEAITTYFEDDEVQALVRFPENFDEKVATYDVASAQPAPEVEVYYLSAEPSSSTAYTLVTQLLDDYESAIANKFDINADPEATYDLSSQDSYIANMFSSMFPMLIVFLVFSSIVAVAAESLAGEKERGTLASVLATPVTRRSIGFGKAIAVTGISLLSAAFTVAGLILGMSSMMTSMAGEDISLRSTYGVADYIWLALTVLSVTALLAVIAILLSGFAKTTKDAQVLSLPAYAVVMVAGVATVIEAETKTGTAWYLIPIYNSIEAMKGIFALDANPMNIAVTVAVNLALTAVGIALLAKMLDSERLMFQR